MAAAAGYLAAAAVLAGVDVPAAAAARRVHVDRRLPAEATPKTLSYEAARKSHRVGLTRGPSLGP